MKTNNAFDPLNLSEGKKFAVIPEYLHTRYQQAAETVYEWHANMLRNAFGQQLKHCTGLEHDPETLFVYDAERSLGFWMPSKPDTFAVSVLSNGFEHPDMDSASLGMAVTLLTVNHFGWYLADGADQDSAQWRMAQQMSDLYLSLRDWAFDLSEQGLLDGGAIAGFID